MVPNASDLAARRLNAFFVVRVIAVLAFAFGLIPLVSWLIEGISDGDLLDMSYYAVQVVMAVVCCLGGVACWLFAPWWSRRLVPHTRSSHCPACGYSVSSLPDRQCPECGLVLTDEFDPEHVAPGETASDIGKVALLQLNAITVGRLIALPIILILGMITAITVASSLINLVTYGRTDIFSDVFIGVTLVACCAAFLVPFLLPRWYARRMAPARLFVQMRDEIARHNSPSSNAQAPVPPAPAGNTPPTE